jgi:hypothetical protein
MTADNAPTDGDHSLDDVVNSLNGAPGQIERTTGKALAALALPGAALRVGDRTARPAQVDKLVKKTHLVCPYRDARFMRDLQRLYDVHSVPSDIDPLVCVCDALPLSTTPPLGSVNPSPLPGQLRSSKSFEKPGPIASGPSTASSVAAAGRVRSKVAPWWLGKYLNEPVRRYLYPALWRDTSDYLRCHYAHHALRQLGQVHTINLRLRDDIEALARARPNPLAWLQKRVDRELFNALERPVEFFLTIEEDAKRWHCHGEFQVNSEDIKLARRALRKAGGKWKVTPQFQAKTQPDPDDGWSCYVSKDFWKATPSMRGLLGRFETPYAVTYRGSNLSITTDLNARAKRLYEMHRSLLLQLVRK